MRGQVQLCWDVTANSPKRAPPYAVGLLRSYASLEVLAVTKYMLSVRVVKALHKAARHPHRKHIRGRCYDILPSVGVVATVKRSAQPCCPLVLPSSGRTHNIAPTAMRRTLVKKKFRLRRFFPPAASALRWALARSAQLEKRKIEHANRFHKTSKSIHWQNQKWG